MKKSMSNKEGIWSSFIIGALNFLAYFFWVPNLLFLILGGILILSGFGYLHGYIKDMKNGIVEPSKEEKEALEKKAVNDAVKMGAKSVVREDLEKIEREAEIIDFFPICFKDYGFSFAFDAESEVEELNPDFLEKEWNQFFEKAVIPEELKTFSKKQKRNTRLEFSLKDDVRVIDEVISMDKLKEENEVFLFQTNDRNYYLKKIIIFAFESEGHGALALNYSKGLTNPSIIYIENDPRETIATSFQEFENSLKKESE